MGKDPLMVGTLVSDVLPSGSDPTITKSEKWSGGLLCRGPSMDVQDLSGGRPCISSILGCTILLVSVSGYSGTSAVLTSVSSL